jgi:hypothetical protein
MRLNIDRWSGPAARTALELIPGTRVRPAAAYFRAGHLLLDALTRRLSNLNDQQRVERQATEEENLPRSSHLADGHVDDIVHAGSPLVSAVIFSSDQDEVRFP